MRAPTNKEGRWEEGYSKGANCDNSPFSVGMTFQTELNYSVHCAIEEHIHGRKSLEY